jgi:hypothetical protein
MSIADNIEKEFARLLRESRSVARHKLVAQAADKEDAIRAKRPRKEKNKKSVIEEAHPGEVFVAESDGLGGLAGNPEQVQQQILDALNRRPSAFPYQGLVANAMADFEKTAEVLESHNLFSEAAAIRKVAAEWLSVLERRGGLKKKASDGVPDQVISPSGEVIEDFINVPSARPNAPGSAKTPPSASPPPSGAFIPDAEEVRGGAAAASAEGKAATRVVGPVPVDPSAAVADAKKAADATQPLADAGKAAAKAKGFFSKALKYLGVAGDAAMIGSYALDKDWTSVIGTVGAGGVAAAAAALSAPLAAAAGGVTAAAGIGIGIYSLINETILGAWQEDLETDINDAIGAVQSVLDDNDTDTAQRSAAQTMMNELQAIVKNISVLRQEAKKGERANMNAVAQGMSDIEDSVRAARIAADDLKGATVFDLGVRKVIATLDDIEESNQEFNEELQSKVDPSMSKLTDAIKQISAAAAARKGIIGELNINVGGSSPGSSSSSSSQGSPAVSTDDPAHIKEVQAAINDLQAADAGFSPRLALTGKWDPPTEKALESYVQLWLEVDPGLVQVISVESLKDAEGSVIRAMNRDYRNKEEVIASIMRASTNK